MGPVILAVVIGAVVGACRRPLGAHLATPELHVVGLAVAGLGLQLVGSSVALPVDGLLLALSLAALAAFAFWNRHLVGMGVLTIGIACNAIAVALHGAMPVRVTALIDSGAATAAQLATTDLGFGRRFERTSDPAPWLGDAIPVDLAHAAMSFGDLIALAGIAALAGELVRYSRRGSRWSLADLVGTLVIIGDPDAVPDEEPADGPPDSSARVVSRLRGSTPVRDGARRPAGRRPAAGLGR